MPKAEKLLTTAVKVILTIVFIRQVAVSMQKWLDRDIGTTMSFEHISRLRYPSVTFVRAWEENSTQIGTTFSQIDEKERRQGFIVKAHYRKKLRNGTRTTIDLLDAEEIGKQGWNLGEIWEEGIRSWYWNHSNKFVTFNAPFDVSPGLGNRVTFQVNVSEPNLDLLIVILHNRNQLLPLMTPFSGSFGIMYVIDHDSDVSHRRLYKFNAKHVMRNKHDNRLCNGLGSVDYTSCYNKFVQNSIGCAYPWNAEKLSGLPPCSGPDEVRRFWELTQDHYDMTKANLSVATSCKPPCDYFHLGAELVYNVEENYGKSYPKVFEVSFCTLNDEIPVEVQKPVYDCSNLVADIGGYLGLLLGASILSFYKCFLDQCQRWRSRYVQKRMKACARNGLKI